MPLLTILPDEERHLFETPPQFTTEERKHFFSLPQWAQEALLQLRTPESKVGFILQLGYFRKSRMFFSTNIFHEKDIAFVMKRLQEEHCTIKNYDKTTLLRHRKLILERLGYTSFSSTSTEILEAEIHFLLSKQVRIKDIFDSLLQILEQRRIEIPKYYFLAQIITLAYRRYEQQLLITIDTHLRPEEKKLLDTLMGIAEEYKTDEKQQLKLKRYAITLLKRPSQSTKPHKIKGNLEDLLVLKEMFDILEPVLSSLRLSPEMIRQYATVVLKAQIFQIARRDEKRYLYLLCFIAHQYYSLQDFLIDVLLKVVQAAKNIADQKHREEYFASRAGRGAAGAEVTTAYESIERCLQIVEQLVFAQNLSAEEKVGKIQTLVEQFKAHPKVDVKKALGLLKKDSKNIERDADYYNALEAQSLWLQSRATELVKNICFNEETSHKKLMQAITYFIQKEGKLGEHPPTAFLAKKEQPMVLDTTKRVRVSLYKILFFTHVADAIKSGGLNLKYSYRYRSLDEYMIPKPAWKKEKALYLQRAGLISYADSATVLTDLETKLHSQYETTNKNILEGKNSYISVYSSHQFTLTTPREDVSTELGVELFPQARFVSLCEVLATINTVTNFLDAFTHLQRTHFHQKPAEKVFFAGIMGLGCNIGIPRFAQIAKHINQSTLERTVNWYFSANALSEANDKIISFMNTIPLTNIFDRKDGLRHTASDGQKLGVHGDSLLASRSYKYFGKDQGITAYTFRDNHDFIYHSTVFSPTDREAMYVADGMMHNDVVKSDMHSTDTHGVTPLSFAVLHFLNVFFAPRIKDLSRKTLYTLTERSTYARQGFGILPDKPVDQESIEEQWDDILRFIATIKLKETPASQLFQRLNSYSTQHPLYKALQQFGEIIQTIFILRYIDEPKIRQDVEKELNRIEHINRFSKAVFHGSNQEFHQEAREDQLIAERCKRLIENAIICWNYLHLSQKLAEATDEHRQQLLEQIRNSSMAAWHHINLLGEYDFSDERMEGIAPFPLEKILALRIF